MDLKYIQNISKESADIYLYDEIGWGVNAQGFVNELNYLANTLEVPVINVRINSPGGSVIDGMGIFAAIQNSTSVVNTYIDGIAASAAGFIAMAGKKRYMAAHGLLMMHGVSYGSSDDPNEQARIDAAINAMETSIATILSNNSGLSLEEIKVKMNQETWINANEALELKFVDSVFDNTPKKRMGKNELMDFVNKLVKPNNKTMDKVLNYFNLSVDTTEDVVIEKIKNLQTEADKIADLEKEIETLKAEKVERENAALLAEATKEVEEAINAGKFPTEKKDELIETAKNDLAGFRNIVSSISNAKAPDLTNLIKQDGNSKHMGKTFRELEKTKDGLNYLTKLADENPEEYKNFYNESYKK